MTALTDGMTDAQLGRVYAIERALTAGEINLTEAAAQTLDVAVEAGTVERRDLPDGNTRYRLLERRPDVPDPGAA